MAEYETGCLARSLCGHDKGGIYIILNVDAEYVYLADGRHRTVGKPKRKKKKHVQVSRIRDKQLHEKLISGKTVTDEAIKYFIKCCGAELKAEPCLKKEKYQENQGG